MRNAVICGLAAVSLLAIAQSANATPLLPGTSDPMPFPRTAGGGPIDADTGVQTWSVTGIDSQATGTWEEIVYTDSNTGFLDFLYTFASDSTSTDDITNISMASFANWTTDVQVAQFFYSDNVTPVFCTATPGVTPVQAHRSGGTGSTVTFDFADSDTTSTLNGGDCTFGILIATNATTFGNGDVNLEDDGSTRLFGYAPAPGPILGAGLPGLIFGCAGLIGLARRRRARAIAA